MNDSFYGFNNDIYTDNNHIPSEREYDDLFHEEFLRVNDTGTLTTNLALKCTLALVSRIGFIFVQVGSIPVENVYVIVLHNLIEISVGILSYGVIGNLIAFGPDSMAGWVSLSKWKWDDVSSMTQNLDGALIGFCSILLATAQVSSFLVGRISLAGGMLLTAFYCGLFQPFLMHWIWHEKGWMRRSQFLGLDVSVKDHAGALALHIPSAIFGTIGSLFLGRRILVLKNLDRLSFGSENAVTTIIGYLLITFNYIVFALPNPEYESRKNDYDYDYSGHIVVNSLLAMGGGIVTVTVLQRIIFRDISRFRKIVRSVEGGVAGLISLAAAVDLYYPSVSIILSMIASIVFFFFAEVIHNTALEDPCSFIASHFVCGFLGVMLCCLLAQKENLGNTVRMRTLGVHLLWQFICTCVVIAVSVIAALFLFVMLKILGVLRNNFEIANHRRAEVIRHGLPKRSFLERLFNINSTTDYVGPGFNNFYFNRPTKTDEAANVSNSSVSRGDKTKKRVTLGGGELYRNKGFNATVMRVNTGQLPAKPSSNWPISGCGDYNPCLPVESVYL